MKFYRDRFDANYWDKICKSKLSSIYLDYDYDIRFYKNGNYITLKMLPSFLKMAEKYIIRTIKVMSV
jgi:hypothetical protein